MNEDSTDTIQQRNIEIVGIYDRVVNELTGRKNFKIFPPLLLDQKTGKSLVSVFGIVGEASRLQVVRNHSSELFVVSSANLSDGPLSIATFESNSPEKVQESVTQFIKYNNG